MILLKVTQTHTQHLQTCILSGAAFTVKQYSHEKITALYFETRTASDYILRHH